MFSLPRSRQWLLPALVLLIFVLFYRSIIRVPASVQTIIRYRPRPQVQYGVRIPQEILDEYVMPLRDPSQSHVWPDRKYYYKYLSPSQDAIRTYLEPLLQCHRRPNPHTKHIRLPNLVQNVSQLSSPAEAAAEQKFNPTIIALPPWSPHQYLLVSRVVTEGLHQESLLCEADTCYSGRGAEHRRPGEKDCTADDVSILGAAGGLHCATPPTIISIPPTPAERCEGTWSPFPDIPGFHDPRIFWSGKGEPLIMVNSASRYACVGLWITDLRTLHEPLTGLLTSQPGEPQHSGPLMSYPSLTELTRNPVETRAGVEKNWFLFFPTPEEAFLHYDLSIPRAAKQQEEQNETKFVGGRTFAKLIGNGFTTPNLTDPDELPCLHDEPDMRGKFGHWHQTSNSLKLILCRRGEAERGKCSGEQEGRAVHFAVMHRKFSNEWDLPLRYERFFVVWDARPPYRMLGISRYPVLMWNETASGWGGEDNWATMPDVDDDDEHGFADSTDSRLFTNNSVPHGAQKFQTGTEAEARRSGNLTKRSRTNTTHTMLDLELGLKSKGPNPHQSNLPSPNRNWAYFTYTPSIAWAFRPFPAIPLNDHEQSTSSRLRDLDSASNSPLPSAEEADAAEEAGSGTGAGADAEAAAHTHTLEALNVGYLDDEVVLGIGVDDQGQGFARVRAEELLGCLSLCPVRVGGEGSG